MCRVIVKMFSNKECLLVGGVRKSTLVSDIDLTCPCNLKEAVCDTGCCCDQVIF